MARDFQTEPVRTPAGIARTTIHVSVIEDEAGNVTYADTAEVVVRMADGSTVFRTVAPLRDHLPTAKKLALKDAVDGVHAEAKTRILP